MWLCAKRLVWFGVLVGSCVAVGCSGGGGATVPPATGDAGQAGAHPDGAGQGAGGDAAGGGPDAVSPPDAGKAQCSDQCQAGVHACAGGGVRRCEDTDGDGCVEWTPMEPCAPGETCVDGVCQVACPAQPCTTVGAKKCDGNAVVTCQDANGDGCLEWAGAQPCGAGQTCSAGHCAVGCTDECTTAGAKKCEGDAVLTCGNYDGDDCLEWSPAEPCGQGEVCSGGTCAVGCTPECTVAGATQCEGAAVKTCGNYDSDPCLEWGSPVPCDAGQTCSGGVCQATCSDECSVAGATQCQGNAVQTCGNYDDDACMEWSTPVPCDAGLVCSVGQCQTVCQDECAAVGVKKCSGNAVQTCGDANGDGCLEWGSAVACAPGQTCSNGFCTVSCTDECSPGGAQTCEADAVKTCGDYDGDPCLEWGTPVPCPSGQSCSGGHCAVTCADECTVQGAKDCQGNTVVTCGDYDDDSCLEWGVVETCQPPMVCSAGACTLTCTDTCSAAGDVTCDGPAAVATCGDWNQDGCLEWSDGVACPQNEVCSSGQCELTCSDECQSVGQVECVASGFHSCDDWDSDGCLEWGTTILCSASETCQAGACVPKPAPAGVVIDEVLYDANGADLDTFVELRGPAGTDLAGFSLVGINGTNGQVYSTVELSGVIASDGLFVVVNADAQDTALLAAADLVASGVDFQNGPDSIQLRWGDQVVDAVGYGNFSGGAVFAGEGQPAVDVAPGHSLGRDEFGTDTDNNAADFHDYATPTPGAANAVVNEPPVAVLACPATAQAGEAVSIDASGSHDPDGTIETFGFEFGDGDFAEGSTAVVTHAYSAAGDYIVTLTVTDDAGAEDTAQCTISVVAPVNQPPVAQLSCPASGEVGQSLSFDASGSSDPDGTIADYAFDFGDGTTTQGTASVVSHAYASAGNYTVSVTVTDDEGAQASAQCAVAVSEPAVPDLIVTADQELCGKHVVSKFQVLGGATVTCSDGSLEIEAEDVLIDPASAIDLSASVAMPKAAGGKFCSWACVCDPGYTGGGGGGNATAGAQSPSTAGSARSPELGGCLGSCTSHYCSGAAGGKAKGSAYDLSAPGGQAGGDGCKSGFSSCSTPLDGGAGGGSVVIVASNSMTVQGTIRVDGADGGNGMAGAGGGAGGSIVLAASSLSVTGTLSAASGEGGKGSLPSLWSSHHADGGNGGKGWIKLLHGASYTNTASIAAGAVLVESVMPPMTVGSPTHPEPSLAYNDVFDEATFTWEPAFAGATGYWYALTQDPSFELTPQNGTYTTATQVTFPSSAFTSAGTWYFYVVAVDDTASIGTVANRFAVHVNASPPEVSSSSHPDSSQWYSGKTIALSWKAPPSIAANSFTSYRYRLDRIASVPSDDTSHPWTETQNTQVVLTEDADGNPIDGFAYHFHVVAIDTQGNPTSTSSSFLIQIGPEPSKASFFGYVHDASGNAVSGATVRLEPYGHETTTDGSGYFLFGDVYQGPYTLFVDAGGFAPFAQSVDLTTASLPYDVVLSP